MNNKIAGKRGEKIAREVLKKAGYVILESNFYSKFGEIDIIATDKDTLVFVEVKARSSSQYGTPEESITAKKIESIIKTAAYYRLLHKQLLSNERIDLVAIEFDKDGKLLRSEIIKNIQS